MNEYGITPFLKKIVNRLTLMGVVELGALLRHTLDPTAGGSLGPILRVGVAWPKQVQGGPNGEVQGYTL